MWCAPVARRLTACTCLANNVAAFPPRCRAPASSVTAATRLSASCRGELPSAGLSLREAGGRRWMSSPAAPMVSTTMDYEGVIRNDSWRRPDVVHLPKADRKRVVRVFQWLRDDKGMRQAWHRRYGFNADTWAAAVTIVQRQALRRSDALFPDRASWEEFVRQCAEGDHLDMSQLLQWAVAAAHEHLQDALNHDRAVRDSADLRVPHLWYPHARALKRKLLYHAGPTNSGKTYHALQRLAAADSGVYCGPLRLLALEVHERLNMEGVVTNLITGQEKKVLPFASHVACTVETANVMEPVDVAVVDEIQMIADPYRGWAWTRAVMGLAAEEVHVCGDASAIPLMHRLAELTGDELEVKDYTRHTDLTVHRRSLKGDLAHVRQGDCIIAFSRKDIYRIRAAVQSVTGHKCCVVYGSLPPETRSAQARLFNDPDSGYDVLVASDAVGMGLNLNIRRVVFSAMEKFDGDSVKSVSASQVKQIAGRAGRFGSRYPNGEVTTLYPSDVRALHRAMDATLPSVRRAGIFPSVEQLERFASLFPASTKLSTLLDKFADVSQLDKNFSICRHEELKQAAQLIEHVDLTLADRFTFCQAPFNLRMPMVRMAFQRYVSCYSEGESPSIGVRLPRAVLVPSAAATLQLEGMHQVIDMYLWMHQRFPVGFPHNTEALALREQCAALLQDTLERSALDAHRSRSSNKRGGKGGNKAKKRRAFRNQSRR